MKGGNLNFNIQMLETMEESKEVLKINKEDLQNMTLEDLVDLQFELDDMLREVKELIAECDDMLKEEV